MLFLVIVSGKITKVSAEEDKSYVTFVEQVLRHTRSDRAKPLAHFQAGEELALLEKAGGFFKVRTQNGQTGYVERSLVTSKENYQDYQEGAYSEIHPMKTRNEPGAKNRYIVVGDAILRTGDRSDYRPIALVQRGTELDYYGTTDNRWFLVRHNDQMGYIYRGDVTSVKNYEAAEQGQTSDIHEVALKESENFDGLEVVMDTSLRAKDNREYAVVHHLNQKDLVQYEGTTHNNWFLVIVNPGEPTEQKGYIQRGHVTKTSAVQMATHAVEKSESLKTQASVNRAQKLIHQVIDEVKQKDLQLRLAQVQAEINRFKNKEEKVAAIKEALASIDYVAVSEDGLEVDPAEKWTTAAAKATLEKIEQEAIQKLSLQATDYTVEKGQELYIQVTEEDGKGSDRWRIADENIGEIIHSYFFRTEPLENGKEPIQYEILLRGLKKGITQLNLSSYFGKEKQSLSVKVTDSSVIELSIEELDALFSQLNNGIKDYKAAQSFGKRQSDQVNYQNAVNALELAEASQEKSDFERAKRLLELVVVGEEKTVMEERLAQLKIDLSVPITISAYEGSEKELVIPEFIDGEDLVDNNYMNFVIGETLQATDIGRVERIEGYAFYEKRLKSVVIPDSVREIGVYAFASNELEDLVLPASLTQIAGYSFRNAYRTYSPNERLLVIPKGVNGIGTAAFENNQIDKILLADSITHIGDRAFAQNDLVEVKLPVQLVELGFQSFAFNELTELTIPEKVEIIGDSAFSSNKLKELSLSNNVKEIGTYAFSNNLLEKVKIPTGIDELTQGIFKGNRLHKLVIPENIQTINYLAFDLNILSEIVLPDNLEIDREILGANDQLKDSYESTGKMAGKYTGSQSGPWIKQ